jgi:hypothetical protein
MNLICIKGSFIELISWTLLKKEKSGLIVCNDLKEKILLSLKNETSDIPLKMIKINKITVRSSK